MTRFNELVAGYRRFREQGWVRERERWAELAEGQNPKVMVIACSDSRVEPAQIFDVKPGEIFVVRNVANLAPPFETTPGRHGVSAALEFAVTQLEVEEIVVVGHGSCGGCAAALTGQFDSADHGAGHFIAEWVELLREARDRVKERHPVFDADAFLEMELEAVRVSLANLRTFPWIAERENAGKLTLHGAHFAITKGQLYLLDEAEAVFRPA
ncbi:MAG: carbonic anhydrase [Pseudomonadota bacterium]|nr:carbonic anhydrase [Pseudomonadota bacterium]